MPVIKKIAGASNGKYFADWTSLVNEVCTYLHRPVIKTIAGASNGKYFAHKT